MDNFKLILGILCAVFGVLFSLIKYRDEKRRIAFINRYDFSTTLKERFRQEHSSLSDEAVEEVFIALKDFFILNVKGGHYYSHLEHPMGREISAFDIKCDSDWAGSGCSGE
jgi:hypothetical protein